MSLKFPQTLARRKDETDMSPTYCGQAGSRGRGLFSSRDCSAGALLCLGPPQAAAQIPGNEAAVCASCGRFLSKRVRCCCPAAYCSTSCRDRHAARGHALLCPGVSPGDAAAQLAELLEFGGDAALFLPLAVQWVAATAAEAAHGNGRRVMEAARLLVASMAAGGPWVEVGGAQAVPGHYPEEEEGEEEVEEEEEEEEEEEGGKFSNGGSKGDGSTPPIIVMGGAVVDMVAKPSQNLLISTSNKGVMSER